MDQAYCGSGDKKNYTLTLLHLFEIEILKNTNFRLASRLIMVRVSVCFYALMTTAHQRKYSQKTISTRHITRKICSCNDTQTHNGHAVPCISKLTLVLIAQTIFLLQCRQTDRQTVTDATNHPTMPRMPLVWVMTTE